MIVLGGWPDVDIFFGFRFFPDFRNDFFENAKSDAISGVALDATYALTEKVTLYSQYAMLIGEIDTSMIESAYKDWLDDNPSNEENAGKE